jgi:hypothetical protein
MSISAKNSRHRKSVESPYPPEVLRKPTHADKSGPRKAKAFTELIRACVIEISQVSGLSEQLSKRYIFLFIKLQRAINLQI